MLSFVALLQMIAICYLRLALSYFLADTCYNLQKLVAFTRFCTSCNFLKIRIRFRQTWTGIPVPAPVPARLSGSSRSLNTTEEGATHAQRGIRKEAHVMRHVGRGTQENAHSEMHVARTWLMILFQVVKQIKISCYIYFLPSSASTQLNFNSI